jgi:hypothetical protein
LIFDNLRTGQVSEYIPMLITGAYQSLLLRTNCPTGERTMMARGEGKPLQASTTAAVF